MKPAHQIQRRVEFYETDMAGIVHFSNFFRYMEACEHDFLRGLDHELHGVLDGVETGWPRVHASCDFRAPARFGDILEVRLFIDEVRARSVRYRFELATAENLVAEGRIVAAHVAITPDGIRAVALPEALREKLGSFRADLPPPPGPGENSHEIRNHRTPTTDQAKAAAGRPTPK